MWVSHCSIREINGIVKASFDRLQSNHPFLAMKNMQIQNIADC